MNKTKEHSKFSAPVPVPAPAPAPVPAPVSNPKAEVAAWEHRLLAIKAEVDTYTKRREAIIEEVKSIHAILEQETKKIVDENRKRTAKVNEAQLKLDTDKAEFEAALIAFKKEKNALEREKEAAASIKANYELSMGKVGEFIRMVRSGAEKI